MVARKLNRIHEMARDEESPVLRIGNLENKKVRVVRS